MFNQHTITIRTLVDRSSDRNPSTLALPLRFGHKNNVINFKAQTSQALEDLFLREAASATKRAYTSEVNSKLSPGRPSRPLSPVEQDGR